MEAGGRFNIGCSVRYELVLLVTVPVLNMDLLLLLGSASSARGPAHFPDDTRERSGAGGIGPQSAV
jgi:hypothetical protein